MKLPFAEISQETRRLSFTGAGWFPAEEVPCSGTPEVEILVRRKEKEVLLEGRLRFCPLLPCDRCGETVETRLEEEFEYIFTLDAMQAEANELEIDDEDCVTVFLEDPVIDLGELFREQVFLALPAKCLCSENCRGLCPECGAILKDEHCSCSRGDVDSPFAILEKLKRKE